MMTVLVTGGTGFIGKALCASLEECGFHIIILSRFQRTSSEKLSSHIDYIRSLDEITPSQPVDIIINLAGEPLNSHRWNEEQKQRIVSSRVATTQNIYRWLTAQDRFVKLFISGSAIGWYGHQDDKKLDESSSFQPGFSHELCNAWESAARKCQSMTERLVIARLGIVLEKDGGPLKEMLLPYRLGLGGKLGSGQQVWSWIHRKDLVRAIHFIIDNEAINDIVNLTAPQPLPQETFASALAKCLRRPSIFPMPAFVARLVFGEFAEELLLNGQAVYPDALITNAFTFTYPDLESALKEIV